MTDIILKDAFLKLVKEAMDQNIPILDNTLTIRVTKNQIEWLQTVEENYNPNSPCSKMTITEIQLKNRFFIERLQLLVKRFANFELKVYVTEKGHIVLNEHSFITGRWYFENREMMWADMSQIQESLPELFKQENSELTLLSKIEKGKSRIHALEYKFYFYEGYHYSSVKRKLIEENLHLLSTLDCAVDSMQMPCEFYLKKENSGLLVNFTMHRKFKSKNTDFHD